MSHDLPMKAVLRSHEGYCLHTIVQTWLKYALIEFDFVYGKLFKTVPSILISLAIQY